MGGLGGMEGGRMCRCCLLLLLLPQSKSVSHSFKDRRRLSHLGPCFLNNFSHIQEIVCIQLLQLFVLILKEPNLTLKNISLVCDFCDLSFILQTPFVVRGLYSLQLFFEDLVFCLLHLESSCKCILVLFHPLFQEPSGGSPGSPP